MALIFKFFILSFLRINKIETFKIKEIKRLDSLMTYCDSATCRKQTLLSYFRETCEPCGKCDNCTNPPQMIEGTEYAQMAMSAIYRTGQNFGSNHIIDILTFSLYR